MISVSTGEDIEMTSTIITLLGILLCVNATVAGRNQIIQPPQPAPKIWKYTEKAYYPIITSITKPERQADKRWIYKEASTVILHCHHPMGTKVYWSPLTRVEGNPVAAAIVSYSVNDAVYPIQMNVVYAKLSGYAKLCQVSCSSMNPITSKVNTTFVELEQLYKTSKVIINDGSSKIKVEPNDSPVSLTLECKADGNPPPEYGLWSNKTKECNTVTTCEMQKCDNETGTCLENETKICTDENESCFDTINTSPKNNILEVRYWPGSASKYRCAARNKFNSNKWKTSEWVKVSGFNVVKPSWVLLILAALGVLLGQSPIAYFK